MTERRSDLKLRGGGDFCFVFLRVPVLRMQPGLEWSSLESSRSEGGNFYRLSGAEKVRSMVQGEISNEASRSWRVGLLLFARVSWHVSIVFLSSSFFCLLAFESIRVVFLRADVPLVKGVEWET